MITVVFIVYIVNKKVANNKTKLYFESSMEKIPVFKNYRNITYFARKGKRVKGVIYIVDKGYMNNDVYFFYNKEMKEKGYYKYKPEFSYYENGKWEKLYNNKNIKNNDIPDSIQLTATWINKKKKIFAELYVASFLKTEHKEQIIIFTFYFYNKIEDLKSLDKIRI